MIMSKFLLKLGLIMNVETKHRGSVIINVLLTAITGLLTGFGVMN